MGKRLIQQRRGRGVRYSTPSFRFKGKAKHLPIEIKTGTVKELVHCQGHSAPLMRIVTPSKESFLMIAPTDITVGQEVSYEATEPSNGNSFALKDLPDGTVIHNVELRPGDGGKIARSSGISARIVTRTGDNVVVQLPSKKKKTIKGNCRATVGVVAGGGRTEKPFMKAGNKMKKMKAKRKLYPRTSAGSMNVVDHPFGNTRSLRKSKARPAPKNAPPGRKVGMVRPKRSGHKN